MLSAMLVRLHPQKNHDFLIDVFAEIKKEKPDAELILVGTGPLEEKVKSKVVEKGLSDCVHFLGNRKDNEQNLSSDGCVCFSIFV